MTTHARVLAGRFRTIRRLGAGGMASVYLAEDEHLGRKVAIKRVHPERAIDVAPRFKREMRLAASLSHPNLVRLLDAFVEDGAVLLVMEYIDGQTLAERMRGRPLDLPSVRRILRSLGDAVDYLHSRGVIHRDIKPANILLDRAGDVKLTDLGIASAAEATGITTSGSVLGTPAYMAPELFEGRRATPETDVYSLAAVTFEMLTGHRARPGTTVPEIALQVAREGPPDLRDHWPEAGALAAALRRGMARRPNDRPSTASVFVAEVESGLGEAQQGRVVRRPADGPRSLIAPTTPVPAARRPPPRRRERRRLAVPLVLGVLALLVAGVAAIVLSGGGGNDPRGAAGERTTGTTSAKGRTTRERAPAATGESRTQARTTTRARAGSGTTERAERSSSAPAERQPSTTAPASPQPSAGAPSSWPGSSPQPSAATPTGPTPATPEGAVQAFYLRAAADRYDDAWALAAPGLRSQLQGYRAFRAQFGSLRSIRFHRAEVVRRDAAGATVAIATTATHANRVDRCSGTATAAPAASGEWVVTRVAVAC